MIAAKTTNKMNVIVEALPGNRELLEKPSKSEVFANQR